jgi:histone deacetylase complex subunit SAP18
MLIRIFCKFGEHHREEEFSYTQQPVEDEVLVHTWRDATLAELTELLAQEHREVRQSETKCTFKVVFPNGEGKWMSRHLGSTAIGRRLADDISTQTLAQVRFQVGDFMSVAIYPPRSSLAARGTEEKDRVRSEATKRDSEEDKGKEKDGRDKKKEQEKEEQEKEEDKDKEKEKEKEEDADAKPE